jgi:hypothetical protein
MRVQKSGVLWSSFALAVLVIISGLLVSCDSGGSSGDTIDTTATLEDGDSWRAAAIGIDATSTWFQLIDSSVSGEELAVTMTRISDHDPPEGTSFTVAYSEDSRNVLAITGSNPPIDALGRLSIDGDAYMERDRDLTDGEGSLHMGLCAAKDATNATFSGDYAVAFAHGDTSQGDGFYTGICEITADGAGELTFSNTVSNPGYTFYEAQSPCSYEVSQTGQITVDASIENFPDDLLGAVRSDGEAFVLVDTRSDNTYKTIFFGVRKSTGTADSVLQGTWEMGTVGSGWTTSDWGESVSMLTLDGSGNGSFTDNQGGSDSLAIDLTNGTFLLSQYNSQGAVTPSGDLMILVSTEPDAQSGDYYLSVAIKEP